MYLECLKQTPNQFKTKFYEPQSLFSRALPDPLQYKISPDPNFFYWTYTQERAVLFLVLGEVRKHPGARFTFEPKPKQKQ